MKKLSLFFTIAIIACNNNTDQPVVDVNTVPPPPAINYSVVNIYPHDTASFTQGLVWYNNSLYEGTGYRGFSKLLKVNLKDGKATKALSLDAVYFGEGITILDNKIYQLTWEEHKVLVYDATIFKKINEFVWPSEGWGITHNGKELLISTGSSNLYVVNPADFKILRTIAVNDNNGPVANLNELEFVKGFVYANIWQSDYIVKINPADGKVVGRIDCSGLLYKNSIPFDERHKDVLNGIAYDSVKNSFYITGKWWPALFEVKLSE
jgi:glutamine cyclotransferase